MLQKTTLMINILLGLVLFYCTLTGTGFSISIKSRFAGTSIRSASILTVSVDVTNRYRSATLVRIYK